MCIVILFYVERLDLAISSSGSRNFLWGGGGGRFTRGAAMYAKLFERRRGVQSAYDRWGGCSPLTTGGGGAVRLQRGGRGYSRQVASTNSSLTCTHLY